MSSITSSDSSFQGERDQTALITPVSDFSATRLRCKLKLKKTHFFFYYVFNVGVQTQLNQQVKEGEKLMKESEALAERWGNIAERRLVLWHTSDKIKHNRKCEMERTHEAQKRNLTKMKKVGARSRQVHLHACTRSFRLSHKEPCVFSN